MDGTEFSKQRTHAQTKTHRVLDKLKEATVAVNRERVN